MNFSESLSRRAARSTMGVLEPVEEAFNKDVPTKTPGIYVLATDDNGEDDLFAEPNEEVTTPVPFYSNALSFKNILPQLPSKGDFVDFWGEQDFSNNWKLNLPINKKENVCSGCLDDVRNDLKKLTAVIEQYKKERDAAKEENEALQKELEDLKKLLKKKEENEKSDVQVKIANKNTGSVDILLKTRDFDKTLDTNTSSGITFPDHSKRYGVQSFSISLPKDTARPSPTTNINDLPIGEERKNKKTVAELRREFFAKEFQSEQKTFVSHNFLEIKTNELETQRSRLNIRVKPKQKITDLISRLISKQNPSKAVPETPPVTLFQRFEKTRVVWENGLKKNVF